MKIFPSNQELSKYDSQFQNIVECAVITHRDNVVKIMNRSEKFINEFLTTFIPNHYCEAYYTRFNGPKRVIIKFFKDNGSNPIHNIFIVL